MQVNKPLNLNKENDCGIGKTSKMSENVGFEKKSRKHEV